MKTKLQKEKDLEKGKELLGKSKTLVFVDFDKLRVEETRKLRRELKSLGATMFVLKKRLLNILLKDTGFNSRQTKFSLGTIFSPTDLEKISGPVYKFFSKLVGPDKTDKTFGVKKILGGYDAESKALIDSRIVVAIGQLPPREILLGQLVGMIAAPLRTFLYVLSEKSKK